MRYRDPSCDTGTGFHGMLHTVNQNTFSWCLVQYRLHHLLV